MLGDRRACLVAVPGEDGDMLAKALDNAGYEVIEKSSPPAVLCALSTAHPPFAAFLHLHFAQALAVMRGLGISRHEALPTYVIVCGSAEAFKAAKTTPVARSPAWGDALILPLDEIRLRAKLRALEQRVKNEERLLNSNRLESLGQLSAGIAHEINTPMQYVGDNLLFVIESVSPLLVRLAELETEAREAAAELPFAQRVLEVMEAADLSFLLDELPASLTQAREGVEHVTRLVREMRDFVHPGTEAAPTDLNRVIQSTITVAKNEWKYVADVKLELDAELPQLVCVAGEIKQVILNLVVNAAQAIGEQKREAKGLITIGSAFDSSMIRLWIADDGPGMTPEVRRRLFEPFFTTKPVGKGTGQGLHVVNKVLANHKGRVELETEPGEGTRFTLFFPRTTGNTNAPEPGEDDIG